MLQKNAEIIGTDESSGSPTMTINAPFGTVLIRFLISEFNIYIFTLKSLEFRSGLVIEAKEARIYNCSINYNRNYPSSIL